MKQDAFIQNLRHALSGLPKPAIDEILADYREYIGDALAAGRDEEEVIAALGEPAKLARELKAQASYREWESHRSFGNLARVIGSIAGLGLLNMLLLIPFMIYLALLTAGYAMSIGLIIAGLVAVTTLGSHRMFGWPAIDALPFDMQILSNSKQAAEAQHDASEAANDAKEAADDAKDAANEAAGDMKRAQAKPGQSSVQAPADASRASSDNASVPGSASGASAHEPPLLANLKDMKIVGDNFVFKLTGDAHLAIVTTSGPVSIHRDDNGGFKIATPNSAAQALLTIGKDDTISVARKQVLALSLHDNDSRVSLTRDPTHANRVLWDVRSDDGHVSFTQDESGEPTHLVVNSGSSSVELNGRELRIDDGNDHLRFRVRPGSTIAGTALIYGIASLLGGILGLLICIWLTRVTWRALVRHTKRQIDLITEGLENASP